MAALSQQPLQQAYAVGLPSASGLACRRHRSCRLPATDESHVELTPLTGVRAREGLPGFFVEVGRECSPLRDGDIGGQVDRIRRADDRGRQAGVAEREAQDELHIAHARLAQEVGDAGGLPVLLTYTGVLA